MLYLPILEEEGVMVDLERIGTVGICGSGTTSLRDTYRPVDARHCGHQGRVPRQPGAPRYQVLPAIWPRDARAAIRAPVAVREGSHCRRQRPASGRIRHSPGQLLVSPQRALRRRPLDGGD